MRIDTKEIEAIAHEAIEAMERALRQAMIELTRHEQEFVPIDEVSVARVGRIRPMA